MKYSILSIAITILACREPLAVAPPTPQTTWIDLDTHSDTIITNVNDFRATVYYASANWQQSPDTSLLHGYRSIPARYGDSIFVKALNDPSTDYNGPFILKVHEGNDTLTAQNFIDTSANNPARLFIRLP